MTKPTVASLKRDKAELMHQVAVLEQALADAQRQFIASDDHRLAAEKKLATLTAKAQRVVNASAHQWPVDGMAELGRAVKGAGDE